MHHFLCWITERTVKYEQRTQNDWYSMVNSSMTNVGRHRGQCDQSRLQISAAILKIGGDPVIGLYHCQEQQGQRYADRLLVTIAIAAIDIQHYTLTGVPSVLWGLLSELQGQRYGRQTIGHYSNSSNRHTALYGLTVRATGPEVRRHTIGHYNNRSNRHTALYIYRAAQNVCFCCTVTASCKQRWDTGFLCKFCVR